VLLHNTVRRPKLRPCHATLNGGMNLPANTAVPVPLTASTTRVYGYAYVVADLIHVGHLNHLEACKQLCDKLIVGVLTERAVLEQKARPVIPFADRLRMVRALKCVDVAVAQDTYSPIPNILAMQVDILFESTSHTKNAIEEARSVLAKWGGRVLVLPYYSGCSSTSIRGQIKNA
jgi:glycerol-3-phosphate cytidylyltransferase